MKIPSNWPKVEKLDEFRGVVQPTNPYWKAREKIERLISKAGQHLYDTKDFDYKKIQEARDKAKE